MSYVADPSILPIVILWPALVVVVSIILWRRRERGVGLVVLYMALFTAFYWTAAAIQLLPWYTPLYDPKIIQIGFNYAFIGLLAFLVGGVIIGPFLLDFARVRRSAEGEGQTEGEADEVITAPQQPPSTAVYYFFFGLATYFLIAPFSSLIPSLDAFSSNSVKFIFIGVMLLYTKIVLGKSSLPRWLVLIPVAVWPLVTISNEGFIGFGLAGPLVVCFFMFFTKRTPLKPQQLLLGIFIAYFMLSLTSTYFSTRNVIRGSLVGGSLVDRFDAMYDSLVTKFAFLDLQDPERTRFVEQRLDLSYLTGAAIDRLNSGVVDFSYGETLVDSALALIPRAVWPDKPFTVGSSALVTQYTGISFAEGTSVGAGQVMELYINFGLPGVIVGLGILGLILSLLDQGAGRAVQQDDYFRFALMILPAFGLLLIGDDLITIVGTTVSSVITGIIVNTLIRMADTANKQKNEQKAKDITARPPDHKEINRPQSLH